MADFATLGAFVFNGTSGASIVGEIEIGPRPRTIGLSYNALSATIVETTDVVSGFRQITLPVKLAGQNTQNETAANHLRRMLTNLKTEVEKDHNTLTIAPHGWDAPLVYTVHKNEDFAVPFGPLAQSRAVLTFNLTLNCTP